MAYKARNPVGTRTPTVVTWKVMFRGAENLFRSYTVVVGPTQDGISLHPCSYLPPASR